MIYFNYEFIFDHSDLTQQQLIILKVIDRHFHSDYQSNLICDVGYDPDNGEIEITFQGGKLINKILTQKQLDEVFTYAEEKHGNPEYNTDERSEQRHADLIQFTKEYFSKG